MTSNNMINNIIAMSKDQQAVFYDGLRASGMSDNEILIIQKQAFFIKLFNDPMFYEDIKNAAGDMVYEALTNE